MVLRSDLIQRIRATTTARIITLVAPAGYGKSTTLSQWMQEQQLPSASLTIRHSHNDPAQLLSDVSQRLSNAGILPSEASSELQFSSATALSIGVRRLRRALEGCSSGLLVLDQLEALRSTASKDVLAELVFVLQPTLTIAMASRTPLPIATSVLRTQGELLELMVNDLAMSVEEAGALSEIVGVDLDERELRSLVLRTEGWPTGLYLAYLAMRSGTAPATVLDVGGDDRFISQYLRSEVIQSLTPARRAFLERSSVMEVLSSDLCDFVLERTGSARVLASLAETSRFVVPVDRVDHQYRYHQLLREYLMTELQRRDPDLVARIHLRAATWFEEHNMPIEAIHHAMAANDPQRVAGLVMHWGRRVFSDGQCGTVLEWVGWFEAGDHLDDYPGIALIGALAFAELGDQIAVDRLMAAVDRTDDLGPLAPAAHIAAAFFCRNGIQQSLTDARAAADLMTPASEWHSATIALEGVALLWSGQPDEAAECFEVAAESGERFAAAPAATYTLACLATLASRRGDVAQADALARRALGLVHRTAIESYATSVLAYVVAARCALRRGDPDEAQSMLSRAHVRRTALTTTLPVVAVHTLVEVAETQIEMADFAGAREILREIAAIINVRSLGILNDRYRELRDLLDQMPAGHTGAATLTKAELRLLPLLATHLSFPEIGDRLYISRHTVKTEAMSIYRKLGASSRSEAVDRAREMRLLNV